MEPQVLPQPSDKGGCIAYPAIAPGCTDDGDAREEAIVNTTKPLVTYLE
jgi:hypothetical protein